MSQETIGEALARELSRHGLDAGKSFEAAQLVLQTSVSLAGGLVVAILAYWLIHSNQIRAARDGRRIERARLLHDLDREYFSLMASRCLVKAKGEPRDAYPSDELWNLEYALTARVVWFPAMQMDGSRRIYHSINHSRFVRIHDEWLIDTLILHHVAAWARRISNSVEAGILARRDVAGLWRNILPWARDNRFSFMMDLFGSTAMSRLKAAGKVQPETETPLGYVRAVWPLRGLRAFWHGFSMPFRAVRDAIVCGFNRRKTLRRRPPADWPADIAPLYTIIHTVVAQSIIHGQLEALDYVCMIDEPTPEAPDCMDPRLRATLLTPR